MASPCADRFDGTSRLPLKARSPPGRTHDVTQYSSTTFARPSPTASDRRMWHGRLPSNLLEFDRGGGGLPQLAARLGIPPHCPLGGGRRLGPADRRANSPSAWPRSRDRHPWLEMIERRSCPTSPRPHSGGRISAYEEPGSETLSGDRPSRVDALLLVRRPQKTLRPEALLPPQRGGTVTPRLLHHRPAPLYLKQPGMTSLSGSN